MEQIRSTTNSTQDLPIPGPVEAAGASEPSFVEALIDPAAVFRDPHDVAEQPWFTDQEKRTVLLSWARDELVLEQVAFRALPELRPRSRVDAVIEALGGFDPGAAGEYPSAVARIRAEPKGRRRERIVEGAGP